MARYSGDARIVYSGNVELARQYVSEARKYLGALDRDNTTETASRHVTNSDGIRFFVANYMGQRQIEIWAPGGEEKEGAGTVQGFLLSPRTLVGPQAYSTSPHVLLEPAKSLGANWKSYFCLPNSTHPDPAYPYDVKTLNTVLVALNTNALTSNVSSQRGSYALSFWSNNDENLFLQYYGRFGYSSPSGNGWVYHNGKEIFSVPADHPAPNGFVDIAAVGAKRTGAGLDVIIATYQSQSFSGPCYLKVLRQKLVPTAAEKARLAQYATSVDNVYSYAAEYEKAGAVEELYSVTLSKNPFQVWFCMSINGSCTELRGIVTENPGGVDVLNEYVIDLQNLASISHAVVRTETPIPGNWYDAYTGHIKDCPVYGEAFLADPGATFRFRTYVENPSATGPLDAYVRTAAVWYSGADRGHLTNIGYGCAIAFDVFGANQIYAGTDEVFNG